MLCHGGPIINDAYAKRQFYSKICCIPKTLSATVYRARHHTIISLPADSFIWVPSSNKKRFLVRLQGTSRSYVFAEVGNEQSANQSERCNCCRSQSKSLRFIFLFVLTWFNNKRVGWFPLSRVGYYGLKYTLPLIFWRFESINSMSHPDIVYLTSPALIFMFDLD